MTTNPLGGTVHEIPEDLVAAIQTEPGILALWQGLTPLGRNEFICGIEDARQAATRARRIARGQAPAMLLGGPHSPHRQEAFRLAASRSDQGKRR